MLLTVQRLDRAVDFSVAGVFEVAMVDSAKMTYRREKYALTKRKQGFITSVFVSDIGSRAPHPSL